MIDKITIDNFQSHKRAEITLTPGVNVIVGVSDAGKSAIVRALKWLVFNRPLGDGMRSHWGGDTQVTVEMEGIEVAHKRTDSKNVYLLNDSEFKAIGSDVPKEIADVLKISDINFQGQIDPHFLLSNSAGEVAAQLNKAVNLSKIDTGGKNLKSSMLEIERGIKQAESEISNLQVELDSYNYIDECTKQLKALEAKDKERNELSGNIGLLSSLVDRIKEAQKLSTSKDWSKKADKLLCRLEVQLESIQELKQKIKALDGLRNEIGMLMGREGRLEKELKSMQDELKKIMPEICPVCGQRIKQ